MSTENDDRVLDSGEIHRDYNLRQDLLLLDSQSPYESPDLRGTSKKEPELELLLSEKDISLKSFSEELSFLRISLKDFNISVFFGKLDSLELSFDLYPMKLGYNPEMDIEKQNIEGSPSYIDFENFDIGDEENGDCNLI